MVLTTRRKYTGKRYRRKRYRNRNIRRRNKFQSRNFGKRAASVSTFRSGSIISDRFFTKLKYNDVRNLTNAAQPYQDYIYRGNSIFDPNFTGAGNQPQGHDQWSAFYNQYRVYASKISVNFITNGNVQAQTIAIVPNLNSTSFIDQIRVIETPYSRHGALAANSGIGRQVLTNFMQTSKMWGVDKQAVGSDDLFRAGVGNNPVNSWYWHVFAYDMGAAQANVFVKVVITYYVEYFDRVQLDTS